MCFNIKIKTWKNRLYDNLKGVFTKECDLLTYSDLDLGLRSLKILLIGRIMSNRSRKFDKILISRP